MQDRKEYMREYRKKNKKCIRAYYDKWYSKPHNKKKASKQAFIRNQIQKYAVLSHYSGGIPNCACCKDTHFEFLSLDHINGGGNAERRKLFGGKTDAGGKFYRWLIKNKYPKGYRVLCMSCNHSYGAYGYCPHNGGGFNATLR